jgi:hypothetical protein
MNQKRSSVQPLGGGVPMDASKRDSAQSKNARRGGRFVK